MFSLLAQMMGVRARQLHSPLVCRSCQTLTSGKRLVATGDPIWTIYGRPWGVVWVQLYVELITETIHPTKELSQDW